METWDIEIGSHKVLNENLCKTEPQKELHYQHIDDDGMGCIAIFAVIIAIIILMAPIV